MTQAPNTKPLLVFDGDCGFCMYWIAYWQQLTGDAVQYLPFQEVEHEHPDISREEFQAAVQYFAPDGTHARGAKASFLTLSHAPGKGIWLWLYRKLPLFARIAEWAYTTISTHRNFFYRSALCLYGRTLKPTRYDTVAWIFLRLFGLICLSTFISFGVQALGLIGSHGILPIADVFNIESERLGLIRFFFYPMVFWFNASDTMIQLTWILGAFFSVLLIFDFIPLISLIGIYLLYLSLTNAGQVFMQFQWDALLLETSLLALFLIHFRTLGIWLLRWLLFRFFLAGALVKLYGGASWRAFTSLYEYFETQPIPTPLAWYAHHLPHTLLRIGTGSALFIELTMPFFIFLPGRLRLIAAVLFTSLQTIIMLTGNFGFFNLLTLLLCFTLLNDDVIDKVIPKRLQPKIQQKPKGETHSVKAYVGVSLFVVITVFFSIIQFQERFLGKTPDRFTYLNDVTGMWHIVGTYGPFAVITYPRYEISIEGSDDRNTWIEYPFKYKPDNINRSLTWIIPHQPRLDWQMWFAALGSAEQNPWFSSLMDKLLEGSESVTNLFLQNPFKDHAPIWVRAKLYIYHFSTSEERNATGAVWQREEIGLYYPETRRKSLFEGFGEAHP